MLKIHGGDFHPGSASFTSGILTLMSLRDPSAREQIGAARLSSLEVLTREGGGRTGAMAKALVGSLVFGPVAGLTALAALRTKHEITFMARLDDGRHFVATGDQKTFAELKAASAGTARASRVEQAEDRQAEISAARAADLVGRYKARLDLSEASDAPRSPPARSAPPRPVFGKR